ncbi:MAG: hypothetical protein AB8B54_06775 [Sphingorhabdus sp.]
MSDPLQDTRKIDAPGWSELIEDAFGINLLGLKTLWASIAAPAQLFSASRTIDWADHKYSPTLRVWLFLIAILMFLQFIWANPESATGQQMKSTFATYGDSRLTAPETVELALQRYVFVYPIVLMLLCMLAALLLRIWGHGTTSVVRIRLYFATILPGSLVTLLTSALTLLVSVEHLVIYIGIASAVVFVIDFITTQRGLTPSLKAGSRAWRAMLLATINLLVYIMASTIAAAIMMYWLAKESGLGAILNTG